MFVKLKIGVAKGFERASGSVSDTVPVSVIGLGVSVIPCPWLIDVTVADAAAGTPWAQRRFHPFEVMSFPCLARKLAGGCDAEDREEIPSRGSWCAGGVCSRAGVDCAGGVR